MMADRVEGKFRFFTRGVKQLGEFAYVRSMQSASVHIQAPGPGGDLRSPNRFAPASAKYRKPGFSTVVLTGVLAVVQPAIAERVTVEYEAEARTVTGQPFGISVPRLTVVRGYFSYETHTPDLRPADPMRGQFVMLGTWDFRAGFLDKVITGSASATATTNLFGSPTLSFNDGGNTADRGIMRINGAPDADVEFGLSISGAAKDLPTDHLPANFTFDPPPDGAPHTFVLKDDSGSMLLGFLSFRQVRPKILSIQKNGDQVGIVWSSVSGKPYALEFSTDLVAWAIIRNDLVGLPQTTSLVDDLTARFPENKPARGFYRILELAPTP